MLGLIGVWEMNKHSSMEHQYIDTPISWQVAI